LALKLAHFPSFVAWLVGWTLHVQQPRLVGGLPKSLQSLVKPLKFLDYVFSKNAPKLPFLVQVPNF